MDQSNQMAGLVENALDFMERAFNEFENAPKYSVIHFYAAVELLLKARLLAEHWSLVIAKPQEADRDKFLKGDFQSVTLDDAIRRLEKVVGSGLTPAEIQQLQRLGRHRNRMMHFFHDADGVAGTHLREEIAVEQLRAWHTLNRLLLERWKEVFRPWSDRIYQVNEALKGHREYLRVRFEAIKADLQVKEQAGARLTTCTSCSYRANEVHEIFGAFGNGECHVCGMPSCQIDVACPDCGTAMIFIDEGFQSCASCGRSVEAEELARLIEDEGRGTKDYFESGMPAHCTACDGVRTVVHHDGELLCASCFCMFSEETMAQCSWCGALNAGKIEGSFLTGCVVCEGQLGLVSADDRGGACSVRVGEVRGGNEKSPKSVSR